MNIDAERDRLMAVRIEEVRQKVYGCAGNAAVSVAAVEPFRAAHEALDLIAELSAEIERLRAVDSADADIALASHRKDVIEECAAVCEAKAALMHAQVETTTDDGARERFRSRGHASEHCAMAIRALKEREAE